MAKLKNDDFDKGNELAISFSQLLVSLATGAIVFGFSLLPDGIEIERNQTLLLTALCLLLSVASGLAFLIAMIAHYYYPKKQKYNKYGLSTFPSICFFSQAAAFVVGLVALCGYIIWV
jgi:hypothetical protein